MENRTTAFNINDYLAIKKRPNNIYVNWYLKKLLIYEEAKNNLPDIFYIAKY